MKLLFKQRLFSWFDSYDIYDEQGAVVYTVQGKLSWGHKLHILDRNGRHLGTVKEVMLTFMPRFELYEGDSKIGSICKRLTFFRPSYDIDFNGWQVNGNFMEWDYTISDVQGGCIAVINKEVLKWTDTYSIEVAQEGNALYVLMVILAIDAEKCSRS